MISLSVPQMENDLRPRITVFGVGGAGGNAVNNMIRACLEGVDFVVANTDAQAIKGSLADKRIQLGSTITRGLGAGSRPDVGRAAAEEALEDIMACLEGANMAFITAGMGGGTGTGAAPVIARAAREQGILTVGVVTKPFHFEGGHRMRLAEAGIQELQQFVDTLIIIPNQNLFRIANEKTTFADAFKMADDVLHSGVRGVTDLMVMPGLINLDFADIRAVMSEMGKAMMGTGEATGDRRAIDAAEAAISNPLLDDVSMKGARGVLINITGGLDMTLFEVDEAANRIRDEVDPDANIIFGSTFDESMEGRMRVSVVATGIDAAAIGRPSQPATFQVVAGGRTLPTRPAAPAPGQAVARAEPSLASALHTPSGSTQVGVGQAAAPSMAAAFNQIAPQVAAPRAEHEAAPAAAQAQAEPAPVAQSETRAAAPAQAPSIQPTPALRGGQAGNNFVAPRPAEAAPRAAGEAAVPRSSLFQRVTSTARTLMGGAHGEQPAQAPVRQAPQPAPARPAAAQPPVQPHSQPAQPRLDAPKPHNMGSAAEDDMLDIPAFLRRQAN
ncbi:MAG TPA: cell division protein FtsZ [Azospirillaceae bacterium]|nr:cell division protein FtsZ [Azospirillaceae bacterium]